MRADATALPLWVTRHFRGEPEALVRKVSGCSRPATLSMTRRNGLVLLRVFQPGADALEALDFQQGVVSAYRAIREQLAALGAHPLRFWNVIPRIRTMYEDGLDRYMVFNAGRHAAYREWHGAVEAFDGALATATGVGHEGTDLHIAVLAGPAPGLPIENPRQKRAYQYSAKYGPLPPCFSRGMLSPRDDGLPTFIVGGTSSVCGEQSIHTGDVRAQTQETLRNIATLIVAACENGPYSEAVSANPLACLQTLRVYVLHEADVEAVLVLVAPELRSLAAPIEIVRADICRPELLVEIEGTATFDKEHAAR